VAEQTVEDVRNVVDGTERDLEAPRTWTPLVDVAKRDGNPKEGASPYCSGGAGTDRELCRGAKAHERMNPFRKRRGTVRREAPTSAKETRKLDGRGETNVPAGRALTTL